MSAPRDGKPVVFHWLWEGTFGGAERIVARGLLEYTDGPFEHRVIIGKSFGPLIGRGEGRYCLSMAHGADFFSLCKIRFVLAAAERRVLCLHQVNPYLLAFAPLRHPTVYVEHGQGRLWKGIVRDILWRLAWRPANRHIAGIVSVSKYAGRIFLERNPSCRKPVALIYNPLLVDPGQPRSWHPQRLRIGFCGRISPEKGAADVLDCAAILRERLDVQFVMIGDGPLRERLERRAASQRLPVRFTGAVDNVRKFLMQIDIIAAPSVEDTFNLAVLEAMAVGAVPVVYPTGGLPEIISSGENGIVTGASNPDSLAAAIERLSADRAMLCRMSGAAYKRASADFGLDRYRREWDAFLEPIIGVADHR